MFRLNRTKDVITLFHKASSPASTRVATLLKQASAKATEASEGSPAEFELNITEDPPTADQVQTILEYVGAKGVSSVVEGARTESEAMKLFKKSAESFKRPMTVDWNNGKAVPGDNESAILKMLNELPK